MRDHRDPKLCIEIWCFHWARSCSVKTSIGQRDKVSDPKIETQNTKENSGQTYPEMEEQGYKGPMTRAKARALEQTNVLMIHYFGTWIP